MNFNFEFTGLVIAGILCIIIAYGFGYQVGFKRGFDGDPLFKKKEEETK